MCKHTENKTRNEKRKKRFSEEFKTVQEVLKETIMNHNPNKTKRSIESLQFNSKNRSKKKIEIK